MPYHARWVDAMTTGVVSKVTDLTLELVSEDGDEAGSLRPPLRLDVVASDASHDKLMKVSSKLQRHMCGHPRLGMRPLRDRIGYRPGAFSAEGP